MAENEAYQQHRENARELQRLKALAGQDIAPLPKRCNADRRTNADSSFQYFCETYFPQLFSLKWSKDHLRVISKIERTVLYNDTFAVAMPRASGKTTLCQIAVIWAIVTGRHKFVFLVASTQEYALNMLENIKSLLLTNELLLEDYPEAVYPIRKLEGESRRCSGQRYMGKLTHIRWAVDEIVMATLPESRCSGAIIRVSGITGNIRGAQFVRPDGTSVRPSLAIIDDPQTDQSARSLSQTHERLRIVHGAIAGLAGPGQSTAIIMPCTVIQAGDLSDQLLDREKNPQWQGERTKMLPSMPTNMKRWEEYWTIRANSIRNGGRGEQANEYYAQHREEMDAGAVASWPERFDPKKGEISAIQHAMNIMQDKGEAAFRAEYQNEPFRDDELGADAGIMSADQIAAKLNGHDRHAVPLGADKITLFIDVHEKLLYYMVCAWEPSFTGYVIDYGTYPEQRRDYFALREVRRTLQTTFPQAGLEGQIYSGLDALVNDMFVREYRRDDGAMMRINHCMIDANWGQQTDTVYQFCRQSDHAAQILASHGRGIRASDKPICEYKQDPGWRIGFHWLIPPVRGKRTVRHVISDVNFWKSFVHARLAVNMGDRGCLSLFGRNPQMHLLLSEHLTSEYRVKVAAKGRVVDEWKGRPDRDNHWLDCLVGCAVSASLQGVALAESGRKAGVKSTGRRRLTAAEIAAAYGR